MGFGHFFHKVKHAVSSIEHKVGHAITSVEKDGKKAVGWVGHTVGGITKAAENRINNPMSGTPLDSKNLPLLIGGGLLVLYLLPRILDTEAARNISRRV